MFGCEIGVYPCSGVLELCSRVNVCQYGGSGECIPLLGLRKEIVVGTVTNVVTVRMK